MPDRLAGHVALVTGGNGGIGLGMARGLVEAGASVAIWGTDRSKNEAAAQSLAVTGRRVLTQRCDVRREDDVARCFADAVEVFGKVDSVFANAGVMGRPVRTTDCDLAEWRRVMSVNLDGLFITLREGARHMVERGEGGSLVAVSSTAAIHGAPQQVAYATTKTAALGLVRSLAVELARHGIRCNALLPGWTVTELTDPARESQRFVENTTYRTPLKRWAQPDEFGPVAVFLADPNLLFHTGTETVVDGGYTVF